VLRYAATETLYIIQEQNYRRKSEYFYLEECDEKGVEVDQLKQSEQHVFVVMTMQGSHVRCPCFCKTNIKSLYL